MEPTQEESTYNRGSYIKSLKKRALSEDYGYGLVMSKESPMSPGLVLLLGNAGHLVTRLLPKPLKYDDISRNVLTD